MAAWRASGVSNIQALYQGTPEMVIEQVHSAVQAGVRIIGPECAVPLRTPLENLKAITQARGGLRVEDGFRITHAGAERLNETPLLIQKQARIERQGWRDGDAPPATA